MLAPLTSYEVPLLAHALVRASEWFNARLRLGDAASGAMDETPETVVQVWLARARRRGARVNLRPWADVRNLGWALVFGMLTHYMYLMASGMVRAVVYFATLEID